MPALPSDYDGDPSDPGRQRKLEELRAAGSRAIRFAGGTVVSMDQGVGDHVVADVLVRDGVIVAVGPTLANHPDAVGAVDVDCRGMIVAPGFVDAHRHCWQTAFRRMIADADLDSYVATIHGGMALHYTPEDMGIGSEVSVLSALESGITTLLDFSHNTRSPEHTDAVFEAYANAGARVVHASAAPNAGGWAEHWPDDLGRVVDRHCSGAGSLATLRMGLDIKRVLPPDQLLARARDVGIGITFDGVLGHRASEEISSLSNQGLLGPDVTLIHCTDISDKLWDTLVDQGVHVTLATTSDEHIGIATGLPPIQKALDVGLAPSLSTDVEVTLSGDMFTQMRATLATQRMAIARRRFDGEQQPPAMMSNRQALEMATVNGAAHLGLGDVTGRIAPGLAADLIVVRAEDISTLPLNNAIGTIVQGCDASKVDSVFVAGQVRKWAGRLLVGDTAAVRDRMYESRDRIATQLGWSMNPLEPPMLRTSADLGLRAHVDGTQTPEG